MIALGVLLALVVVAGVVVWMNWRSMAAGGISAVSRSIVDSSTLVQADKDKINQKIESVMTDFKAEKVSLEQLGKLSETIASGPLVPLALVAASEKEYFPVAKFTPEEAAAAKRSLERCARGISEKKIARTKFDDILAPICTIQPNGQPQPKPKDKVTRDDVVKFVENAKAEADAAGIPDEPFVVDIAKEVCDSIDQVIGTPKP